MYNMPLLAVIIKYTSQNFRNNTIIQAIYHLWILHLKFKDTPLIIWTVQDLRPYQTTLNYPSANQGLLHILLPTPK